MSAALTRAIVAAFLLWNAPALGQTLSPAGGGASLTVGSTPVASGANGCGLYNNSGTLGCSTPTIIIATTPISGCATSGAILLNISATVSCSSGVTAGNTALNLSSAVTLTGPDSGIWTSSGIGVVALGLGSGVGPPATAGTINQILSVNNLVAGVSARNTNVGNNNQVAFRLLNDQGAGLSNGAFITLVGNSNNQGGTVLVNSLEIYTASSAGNFYLGAGGNLTAAMLATGGDLNLLNALSWGATIGSEDTFVSRASAGVVRAGTTATNALGTFSAAGFTAGGNAGLATKTCTINNANVATGITITITGGIITGTTTC